MPIAISEKIIILIRVETKKRVKTMTEETKNYYWLILRNNGYNRYELNEMTLAEMVAEVEKNKLES